MGSILEGDFEERADDVSRAKEVVDENVVLLQLTLNSVSLSWCLVYNLLTSGTCLHRTLL